MNNIKHHLKILPEYFGGVLCGTKTFEVRIDDRPYRRGDTIVLHEWSDDKYSGRMLECVITDVYRGQYAKEGYCIISFRIVVSEGDPRIPVAVYISLFRKYCDVVNELEALKESLKI